MSAPQFVHLRTHSAFSLSQSTLRIDTLRDLASNDAQVGLAITDSFHMFGALEFSKKMAGKGIQPLIGAVVRLRDDQGEGEIVLLAQNELIFSGVLSLRSNRTRARSMALSTTSPARS